MITIKIRTLKKVISILLIITLLTGLFMSNDAEVVIWAAVSDIQDTRTVRNINLQIDGNIPGITNPVEPASKTSEWTGSKVYFGNFSPDKNTLAEPLLFRVLSRKTSDYSVDPNNYTMFLDCDNIIKNMAFDSDNKPNQGAKNSNEWLYSDLRTWLNGNESGQFLNEFSEVEKNAIAQSNRTDDSGLGKGCVSSNPTSGTTLDWCNLYNDKIFALDAKEITNQKYGYSITSSDAANRVKDHIIEKYNDRQDSNNTNYLRLWLRSADLNRVSGAGIVYSNGYMDYRNVESYTSGVSPAMNIDLSSILTASASGFNKTSDLTNVGTDNVSQNKWKLTLKDNSKTVGIQNERIVVLSTREGNKVINVPYTYTGNGINQISVMITTSEYTSSDSEILYYGKLDTNDYLDEHSVDNPGNGTGTFILPEGLPQNAKIYIMAEDVNEGNNTDYSSLPFEIDPFEEQFIDSISVTDISMPIPGNVLDTIAVCNTTGISSSAPSVKWEKKDEDGKFIEVSGKSEYNAEYRASVLLGVKEGYKFADTVTASINEENILNKVYNSDNETICLYYKFLTDKSKLISIQQDNIYSSANGVSLDKMNLPSKVGIITEGQVVNEAVVDWHIDNPTYLDDTKYDTQNLLEQKFVLEGNVSCPNDIDSNGVELKTKIAITVCEADKVSMPTSDLLQGTYTESKYISLSTDVSDAVIYYTMTTDGTQPADPTISDNIYDSSIVLNGIVGKSIVYNIKAIAVKNGMQNSSVSLFTYTIHTHNWEIEWTMNSRYHWHNCTDTECNITDSSQKYGYGEHVYDNDKDDTCNICGYVRKIKNDNTDKNGLEIIEQSESIVTETGKKVTMYIKIEESPETRYQWMVDKNDNNGFVDIGGEVDSYYNIPYVDISYNGYKYKCIIINGDNKIESDVVSLVVKNPVVQDPVIYNILDNSNFTFYKNTDEKLIFRCDGEISKFLNVTVDRNIVDNKNYLLQKGSTILNLKKEYLNSLPAGKHLIKISYTDGYCETYFTIVEEKETVSQSDNLEKPTQNTEIAQNSTNAVDVFKPEDNVKPDNSVKVDNTVSQTQITQSENIVKPTESLDADENDKLTEITQPENLNIETNIESNSVSKDKISEYANETPVLPDIPKTGDRTPIIWLAVIMFSSGAGLIYLSKNKKNKKKKKRNL